MQPSQHSSQMATDDKTNVHQLVLEWLTTLGNRGTRRTYENAVRDFVQFTTMITRREEFRTIRREHVMMWREHMIRRELGDSTVRHRLAALASLFEYLCGKNVVSYNPVSSVKRPNPDSGEGKTQALDNHQACELLAAPDADNLKGKRDRAILSTFLFYALRREELCKLKVSDFRHAHCGAPHLKISSKGEKTRHLPLHPKTDQLIQDYLEVAGHGGDEGGALFRPLRNNRTGRLDEALTPGGVDKLIRQYSAQFGFEIGAHALRATAATNALGHNAGIINVQKWLGHSNIATTHSYDRRKTRREDNPFWPEY
jgi:integrase/recombinase XerD